MIEFVYSERWFKTASDVELETEREKVRIASCSCGNDMDRAIELQNIGNTVGIYRMTMTNNVVQRNN